MTTTAALALLRRGDAQAALDLLGGPSGAGPDPARQAALGMILLAAGRIPDALAALREAVALGDTSPTTLLNLAVALDRGGRGAEARALMARLERLAPGWDEPLLRRAESLRAAGARAAAEDAYRAVLDLSPNRTEALVALGAMLLARGAGAAAQPLLLRACGIDATLPEAWHALGLSLLTTGDAASAESAFAQADALRPGRLDYALHRIDAACAAGSAEAELARLEQASAADPLAVGLLVARGVLLERLGRRGEAIAALEAAEALAPDAVETVTALGGLLARANRLGEAEPMLRRALALAPDAPQTANDLAVVLTRLHRHAAARTLLHDALARFGPQVAAMCNLANATVSLGLQDEAVAVARRAVAFAPDSSLAWRALCNTLPYRDDASGAELLAALQAVSDRLPRGPAPTFANPPDPERRLRLGLLSGTLRTHPVGWLTVAGFEALDPARFDIHCLVQHAAADPIARRFRALSRGWHEVDGMADAALAEFARAQGIDVLIDLGGHGDLGRMPACAFRLAPVQVKWVGMQSHGTGLPEMDWIIADRWQIPPECERFYSERVLRLDDGYVCYSPPPDAPDVGPLPAQGRGSVTFGCFNNLAKVTPRVIATWAAVLRRVGGSRLVLKTHQFADPDTCARVRAAFAGAGIDPARIELRGASPHRAFLGQYNDIDLVLDPFPYSGGLTTCEALWMGVPTVTLPGETFASRHSVSHMSNAGLADWVAADLDGYVALAVAKAGELDALAALRAGLRARVKASPLCDAPRFGRSLGAGLRRAWQAWCARAEPQAE